ncbi:MupG family TIM beta-alpha barrel fold protein [Streptobacillus moniliformis]|uniref:MupG family TIM beta-alpha barrel fold protein n=1 Tax=Streptobacillus moniliformis TaxID=34105 RepID=UPI0007E4C04F|nr:MupG family TIM beta-alpha barrel fold protein [Streptobacillus moniliformis]
MKIGFSIYLSTELEKNKHIILKAKKYGAEFVFTSLNVQEEDVDKGKQINEIIKLCLENNLKLIVDINGNSKDILKTNDNVYYRIDDGYTLDEIIEFSKNNKIVLNSSVLNEKDLEYMKLKKVDFTNILSLHNFYPKKYTGISLEFLRRQNKKYSDYGILNMAFISGDEKRGPVFEGLPTIEEHRDKRALISALELFDNGTDVVLVGDIDLKDENYRELKYLTKGIIPLRIIKKSLINKIFEDRRDSSDYVIRNMVNNRKDFEKYIFENIDRNELISGEEIEIGDILISNEKYKRYSGELEIALRKLGIDEKRDKLTKVIYEDLELLKYIKKYKKFIFL